MNAIQKDHLDTINATNATSSTITTANDTPKAVIRLITFGVETGKRPNKQTTNNLCYPTFKCEWIPNPSSISRKTNVTGESKRLRNEILAQDNVLDFVHQCVDVIEKCISQNEDENENDDGNDYHDHNKNDGNNDNDDNDADQVIRQKKDWCFAFSCARGKHRSISVAIAVGDILMKSNQNYSIVYDHLALQHDNKNSKQNWKKNRHEKRKAIL